MIRKIDGIKLEDLDSSYVIYLLDKRYRLIILRTIELRLCDINRCFYYFIPRTVIEIDI